MKKLAQLYPAVAEMAVASGKLEIPLRREGKSATMFGLGSLDLARRRFRYEGQTVFPIAVTKKRPENDADVEILHGDLTPVAVTFSSWSDSTVGPYDEVRIQLLTTYHRLEDPFLRHRFLSPYLLESYPAARVYPLLTMVSTEAAREAITEILHLPAVHSPSLKVHAHAATKYLSGFSCAPPSQLPQILQTEADWAVDFSEGLAAREPPLEWCQKWLDIQQTVGCLRLWTECLEGKKRVRHVVPHGRSTVTGRAVNDYKGERNEVGTVSDVVMREAAASSTADHVEVWKPTENQYARGWAAEGDASGVAGCFAGGFGFEPELLVQNPGVASVQLLPHRTMLPLHVSDQKLGELRTLVDSCAALLEARKPFMELP
eukprot:gene19919-30637_t